MTCQIIVQCSFIVFFSFKVQRKSFADHLKRDTECHLKLACERLQELQASSTLAAASIEEMQTEMVTAINKNEELSKAVQKSEDLQDSRYKITLVTLSSIQADVDTIKAKVEELKEDLSSSDESDSELEDEVNELQELTSRVDSLQEAITGLAKTNSLRDRRIDGDIDYAKWELQEEFKEKLRLVRANAGTMRYEFQDQLQFIRLKAEENRRLLETVENRWIKIKNIINIIISIFDIGIFLVFSIFCIAILVLFYRYGAFTSLYLLIKPYLPR